MTPDETILAAYVIEKSRYRAYRAVPDFKVSLKREKRAQWNKAIRELRAVGGTPNEVRRILRAVPSAKGAKR